MRPQCVPNASPMRPPGIPNASQMRSQCVLIEIKVDASAAAKKAEAAGLKIKLLRTVFPRKYNGNTVFMG